MTAKNINQKAMADAIRQGQAKIAKGLKTGQMRSDGPRMNAPKRAKATPNTQENHNETYLAPDSPDIAEASQKKVVAGFSFKTAVIGLAIVLQVIVLALGVWIGTFFMGKQEADKAVDTDAVAIKEADTSTPAVPDVPRQPTETLPKEDAAPPKPIPSSGEEPARLRPEKGTNAIVIQSISADRKDELKPIQEFFKKKGIETEIIESGGLGLLVTKTLFMQDPNTEGTDGNQMKKRIMQLGLLYPGETGDTRFGVRPFQDAYGLKR